MYVATDTGQHNNVQVHTYMYSTHCTFTHTCACT